MKKLLTILLLAPAICWSQSNSQALSGEIDIPSLQSLRIEMVETGSIKFSNTQDMGNGKLITGFCRVNVVSSVPWVVHVSSPAPFFTEKSGLSSQKLPINFVEMRGNLGGAFIPITNQPIPILRSDNTRIQNTYMLDLRINAPFNHETGKYLADLIFTISAE
jgi:hypothetical protein